MTDASQRIGIFGGAFDPPHVAHHALAQAALAQYQLDQLRVIPTGQAWHKSHGLTPAEHRLAMARLAFPDIPGVVVDDREIKRPGPTYTIDTLTALRSQYPHATFFLFIGSDQVRAFKTWHRWQDILAMATVVEARRGPQATQWHNTGLEKPVATAVLQMPEMPCNATDIRASIANAQPLADWLLPEVLHYIQQHRLYQANFSNHT